MKRFQWFLALCLLLCFLTSCGGEAVPTLAPTATPARVIDGDDAARLRDLLASMTVREKVGQLLFVRLEALQEGPVTAVNDPMRENLKNYPVGGVVLFSKNIESPEQLSHFMKDLRALPGVPLLSAVDEEGGRISRLASNAAFGLEKQPPMGTVTTSAAAYTVGKTIGKSLAEYGFSMDFAPVADVALAPASVIGDRSFGSDPSKVASLAGHVIDGLHENGVLSCVKHYPGHGDTTEDTHTGRVILNKTWEDMEKCELIPFRALIDKTDAVMVAHVTLPQVDPTGVPSSLSSVVIGKLRREIGFDGLVITDALEMGAIAKEYPSGAASVRAISAGCDVALMPQSLADAFTALEAAVNNGTIPKERLDESVMRVLRVKAAAGLI